MGKFPRYVASLVATLFVSVGCLAQDGEEAFRIGVMTHFAHGKTDFPKYSAWLDQSELTAVRDEMYWSQVEDRYGMFAIKGNAALTNSAWRDSPAGLAPMLVLSFGNDRYGGGQPVGSRAVQAFANYAQWVVDHGHRQPAFVEIWNEWNLGASGVHKGEGRVGDAGDYVDLVRATTLALKNAGYRGKIIVGAIGNDTRWAWATQAIDLGLLEHGDGLSVHLYNHCDSRHVGDQELIGRLSRLRKIITDRGLDTGVYVTEVGWPTHSGACGVSEAASARYLGRFLLEASALPWLKGAWIYELFDGGPDGSEREHRFGILRTDGREKAAGCFVRKYARAIEQRPMRSLSGTKGKIAIFKESDHYLLFAWPDEAASALLDINMGVPLPVQRLDPFCAEAASDLGTLQTISASSDQGAPVVLRISASEAQLRSAVLSIGVRRP